eukprot:352743-Chlamydomonas_euryale.AAC.27
MQSRVRRNGTRAGSQRRQGNREWVSEAARIRGDEGAVHITDNQSWAPGRDEGLREAEGGAVQPWYNWRARYKRRANSTGMQAPRGRHRSAPSPPSPSPCLTAACCCSWRFLSERSSSTSISISTPLCIGLAHEHAAVPRTCTSDTIFIHDSQP